jgi:hypothetical protein
MFDQQQRGALPGQMFRPLNRHPMIKCNQFYHRLAEIHHPVFASQYKWVYFLDGH